MVLEGTPVYIEHPTESYNNCWAIYVEETYYFLMINESYILDYNYLSDCDQIIVEGNVEVVDNVSVVHVKKITKL